MQRDSVPPIPGDATPGFPEVSDDPVSRFLRRPDLTPQRLHRRHGVAAATLAAAVGITAAILPALLRPGAPPAASAHPLATSAFTPLVAQAEDAALSGGAEVLECAACDGNARVAGLGRIDASFDVPAAGRRTITVLYQADGVRHLIVAVNGADTVGVLRVSGADRPAPRRAEVYAQIPAGPVTISLYADPAGRAPDIDKIIIR
ncbi:MAG TPA: hypothetical protein VN408_24930 [Actinoplanes sp.]|nr:hypothetical protein [Actinoplanes sp.]